MTTAVDTPVTVASILYGAADRAGSVADALADRQVLTTPSAGLLHLSANAHQAIARDVSTAVADLLEIDVVEVLIGVWRKHAALLAAARDTAATPGSSAVVDLATENIGCTFRPYVDLMLDGVRVGRVHVEIRLGLAVVGVVAVVADGRLTALRTGRCTAEALLEIEGFLIRRASSGFELPAVVRLRDGIRLLPEPARDTEPDRDTEPESGRKIDASVPSTVRSSESIRSGTRPTGLREQEK